MKLSFFRATLASLGSALLVLSPVTAPAAPIKLTTSPTDDTCPHWHPSNGKIAYLKKNGAVFDIGAVDADGTGEGFLLTGTSLQTYADALWWLGSTDTLLVQETNGFHELLAFDTTLAPFTRTVADGNDAASTRKLLVPGGSNDLVVVASRDGTRVAWRDQPNAGGTNSLKIRTAPYASLTGQNSDTAGTVILQGTTSSIGTRGMALTPTGDKLVIALPVASLVQLWIYNTDGTGTPVQLTTDTIPNTQNINPDISPDGTKILWQRVTATDSDLWVMNLDGTGKRNLTNTPSTAEGAPSWGPDGVQYAFSRVDGAESNLYKDALDVVTLPPTLTAPAASTVYVPEIPISYNLPEAGLAGSLKVTFDDGAGTVRTVTFAGSVTMGNHTTGVTSYSLAHGGVTVTGGNTIPDGVYTVTLSYRDAAGNPAATASTTGVTIYSSLTPAGFFSDFGYGPGTPAPPGYYIPNSGAALQELLDEMFAADPGYFVPLPGAAEETLNPPGTWSSTASTRVRSAPTPRNPAAYIVGPIFESLPAAGSTIDLGLITASTPVSISIKNASTDMGAASVLTDLAILGYTITGPDAASVTVTVAPPGVASPLSENVTAPVSLSVAPPGNGPHAATFTLQTDVGAQIPGGATPGAEYTFTITWSGPPIPPPPPPPPPPATFTAASLHEKGGAVPSAGSDPRIQAGARWNGFGPPAINDAGEVAYVGKWKAPAVPAVRAVPAVPGASPLPAQSGTGIFVDDELVVKVGDDVPDIAGAKFKSLKDPVLSDLGKVAFIATITPAPPASDTVVVYRSIDGGLRVLAREGDPAPETGGALFNAFSSVSTRTQGPRGTLFTASLVPGTGTPVVGPGNDTGVWWQDSTARAMKLVREGDSFGTEKIKSFQILKALGGSPGHGRGQLYASDALLQLTVTGGAVPRQVQARAHPDAIVTDTITEFTVLAEIAGTGQTLGGSTLPDAKWSKMNLASPGASGASLSLLGMLTPNVGGVTSASARGLFVSANSGVDWEPLARLGDPADGLGTGAVFATFKDPVQSSDTTAVAFLGSAKGGTVTSADNDGLWYSPDGSAPVLLAREGGQPPSAPPGAQWKAFTSLALSGGDTGPFFTASLRKGIGPAPGPGGITSLDDFALYGVDRTGHLVELLRENQPLLGKNVKTFNVLKAVAGTVGSARSFNLNGQVAALVTFTDGSTAIIRIDPP